MTQKHLFVIDPLPKLNLKLDSSLRMACELVKAGQNAYLAAAESLSWTIGRNSASAYCQQVHFGGDDPTRPEFHPGKEMALEKFAGIHMRKEPPFDGNYIAATWLLESAVPYSHIFNQPAALRNFNEKLAIFNFPEASEQGLVSCQSLQLYEFIANQCGGDGIVKPLDLFGGRGVFRLQLAGLSRAEALAQLTAATVNDSQMRLVQAFNSAIYDGEVRAFAIGGEPLAWCLKKPKAGDFFANTSAGATLLPYTPPPALHARVKGIAQSLAACGIAVVGFDLIGGSLSEINVTSPRLLHGPDDHHNYYETIATWLIGLCKEPPQLSVL